MELPETVTQGALREKPKKQMEPMFDRDGACKQANAWDATGVLPEQSSGTFFLSAGGDSKNSEVTRPHQVHELSSLVSESLAHEIEITLVIPFPGFL